MTPAEQSKLAAGICGLAPVVPVIVVDDLTRAKPLAEALVAGGLPALEVTLRTPVALDAIRAMAEVEGGVVGAGTLLTPADVKAAKAAGAMFGVSPGATERLIEACAERGAAAAARGGDGFGDHGVVGDGLYGAEVFPRRAVGRGGVPEIGGLSAAAGQLLPDGRDRVGERAGVPAAEERALRRRLVGGAERGGGKGGLDERDAACARGGGAEGVRPNEVAAAAKIFCLVDSMG